MPLMPELALEGQFSSQNRLMGQGNMAKPRFNAEEGGRARKGPHLHVFEAEGAGWACFGPE